MKKNAIVMSVAAAILLVQTARVAAQDPSQTPTVNMSQTPVAQITIEPTRAATATNTPGGESPVARDGRFKVSLVEDLNGDARKDAGDSPPARSTLVELIPWSEVDPDGHPRIVLRLFTAPGGTFEFKDIPPGDYTLAIWWQAGFVSGGTPDVPDVLQAVFGIDASGALVAPGVLPARLPGVVGSQETAHNRVGFVGSVPTEVLLNKIDPNIVPFPVSSGGPPFPPVEGGVLSVRGSLPQGEDGQAPPALPVTGDGSGRPGEPDWAWSLVLSAVIFASVILYRLAPLLRSNRSGPR